MTYTVWTFDDAGCDEMMVFSGSLMECQSYVGEDSDEFYIVCPDGFTVWG